MIQNNAIANMGAAPQRILPALQGTDFNVVVDLFLTPTALACADVLLPAACFAERMGITGHQPYNIGSIVQAVEPLGECKSDQRIIWEIGHRFVDDEYKKWDDEESFYNYLLRKTGFTWEEPLGECKSDQRIIWEIGHRFVDDEYKKWDDEESFYNYLLRKTGFTWEDLKERTWAYPEFEYNKHEKGLLRRDGTVGFATSTGRYNFYCPEMIMFGLPERTWAYPEFEYNKHEKGLLRRDGTVGFATSTGRYNFYCPEMIMFGLPPFPEYEEPPESPVSRPDLAEKYPLVLTSGARQWGFFHSEHRQSPSMRRIHPEPTVLIHPETAAEYGIKDGDWVKLENHLGSCKQRAKLTKRIRKDTVSADHGWWFPERGPEDGTLFGVMESNINRLIPMRPGKVGLGASYKSQLCSIAKFEE